MPTPTNKPGPQGWWEHDTDSPWKTLYRDLAMVSDMQDRCPAMFTPLAAPVVDDVRLAHFNRLQAAEGIDDGKDLTIVEKSLGLDLDEVDAQIIGSCVATSHIVNIGQRSLIEVAILGSDEDLLGKDYDGTTSLCPFGPYSYRAGRRIGGLNGMGDGSFCGAQIEGTMRYGYLPCDTPNLQSDFYPEPKSTRTYREWGARNTLMDRFAGAADQTVLTNSVQCRTTDEAKEQLIDRWAPLQICSSWGFRATNTTLANGHRLWTRRGSWPHSMQVVGIFEVGGRWVAKIRNQWGGFHDGNTFFHVDLNEFDRWIGNSVTMSIGELRQRQFDDPPLI